MYNSDEIPILWLEVFLGCKIFLMEKSVYSIDITSHQILHVNFLKNMARLVRQQIHNTCIFYVGVNLEYEANK